MRTVSIAKNIACRRRKKMREELRTRQRASELLAWAEKYLRTAKIDMELLKQPLPASVPDPMPRPYIELRSAHIKAQIQRVGPYADVPSEQ